MRQNLTSNDPSVNERDELLCRIQELEERCRRAEDALRNLEDQNRLLGDSAPFGIFVTDAEGRVFGANQKMIDMLAWPAGRAGPSTSQSSWDTISASTGASRAATV